MLLIITLKVVQWVRANDDLHNELILIIMLHNHLHRCRRLRCCQRASPMLCGINWQVQIIIIQVQHHQQYLRSVMVKVMHCKYKISMCLLKCNYNKSKIKIKVMVTICQTEKAKMENNNNNSYPAMSFHATQLVPMASYTSRLKQMVLLDYKPWVLSSLTPSRMRLWCMTELDGSTVIDHSQATH